MQIMFTVGWVSSRDPKARPGNPCNECQNEDPGRATPGLPEAHRCAKGITVCKGRALQHAASWRESLDYWIT